MRRFIAMSALIACFHLSACISVISHDEVAAADEAARFGQAALVRRDFAQAYDLLSEAAQKRMSLAQFTEALTKMHPRSQPLTAVPVQYEPMPGQKSMIIHMLGGGDGKEEFFYRIVMTGDSSTGYRVSDFSREDGPSPPSKSRSLPVRKYG
jgi:hypothetical protein